MDDIYGRQKGEPLKAYEIFKDYLEDRDLENVAIKNDKSLDEIKKLAKRYDWDSRVEIYDFEKSLSDESAAKQDYRTMLDIQINLGKMLQAKGAKIIQNSETINEKTMLALKMVTSGVEIERSARRIKKSVLRT